MNDDLQQKICTAHSGLTVALENTQKRLDEDVSDKKRIYEVIDDLKNLLMEHRDDVAKTIADYSNQMASQQGELHRLIEALITGKDGVCPRVSKMEMWWGVAFKVGGGAIALIGMAAAFFKDSLIKIVKWWAA